ncbi:ParB N-terminal domain-containing protein [Aporhodopirellula aestuarii]|uniref:ParB N-terminal domain-containing protein n=1 Tax=Aporhodopirellula aestuarii TaxID=2950107 RepID=A0ABT0U6F5_9BACT|nr:ParB N-terminal domain-containing protein [Aporhodopirellula aestuarii]MCM2371906.1 ParB N-terminal domain-containing protein [Aporhodopirellula aestuarii]
MNENKYSPRYERPKVKEGLQHAGTLVGKIHPMCNSIPIIPQRNFDNMVDSIKENGLLEPIYINHDKQLLDGRSRLMACFVAGVALTADDVKVTEHSPEAIAQSNVARRHLTKNQKLMLAVDRLSMQRKLAGVKRTVGAEKVRQSQKQPDGAKLARSQQPKKRGPRALEKVAKEEEVPRADLALAEKILLAAPDLQPSIESGEISLEEAANRTGVPRKQTQAPRPKKRKPSRPQRDLSVVTEHGDGIRELTAPGEVAWV